MLASGLFYPIIDITIDISTDLMYKQTEDVDLDMLCNCSMKHVIDKTSFIIIIIMEI